LRQIDSRKVGGNGARDVRLPFNRLQSAQAMLVGLHSVWEPQADNGLQSRVTV